MYIFIYEILEREIKHGVLCLQKLNSQNRLFIQSGRCKEAYILPIETYVMESRLLLNI